MEQIFEPNSKFQFDKLVLTNPIFVNSGNYFIKYLMNDSPLYIQPPKCVTKQGFIKGGKKLFCDLLFTNENESFIRWIEDLENYSQKYIYNNRTNWFETDLEMHDIESSFTSPLKIYKSGKFYIVRTNIPTRLGKCTLRIFDEQEMDVPIESIQDGTVVMTIWEIQGIKCSTRNFQIDIEVKQMMIIPKSNLFDRCVISTNGSPLPQPHIENVQDIDHREPEKLPTESFSMATTPSEPNSSSSEATVRVSREGGYQERKPTLPNSSGSEATFRVSSEEAESPLSNSSGSEATFRVSSEEATRNGSPLPEPLQKLVEGTAQEELTPHFECDVVTGKVSSEEAEKAKISDESDNDDEYDQENEFTIDIDEMESDDNIPITANNESLSGVEVIDFHPEDIQEPNDFQLKTRNDVYYEIYTNAKKKAEEARNLAISAFLEAKRIKDLYLIHEPLDIFTGEETSKR